MNIQMQRIISPEGEEAQDRAHNMMAGFQLFLEGHFNAIKDKFNSEMLKMAEECDQRCERAEQRSKKLAEENRQYQKQVQTKILEVQRLNRILDGGREQRMESQRSSRLSRSIQSSASSNAPVNQPIIPSQITDHLSSILHQDEFENLKTFIETDTSSERHSIEEQSEKQYDELKLNEFVGYKITHKKRNFKIYKTPLGIVLQKIKKEKKDEETWNIFTLFSVKEAVVKFRVLEIEKTSIVFGVGLRSELQDHNNINRRHVLGFNPYTGAYRGYDNTLKSENRVDKAVKDFEVYVSFLEKKVRWTSQGNVIYQVQLKEEMKGDLVVFVALFYRKNKVMLCI